MSDYIKRADLAAALSNLLISPWAKRWMDDYAYTAGVQEALHFVQDMVNGEVPAEWKIPAADVAEVVRCKDCWRSVEGKYGLECALRYDMPDRSDRIVPEDGYCSWGGRKEGEG